MKSRVMAQMRMLLLLLLPTVSVAQDPVSVSGTVVDAQGRPLADVQVADSWQSAARAPNPLGFMSAFSSGRTGADGRFTIKLQPYGRASVALLAIDAAQKLGGIAVIDVKQPGQEISIQLAPLVEVRGRFSCNELNRAPTRTNVYITHKPSGWRMLQCDSNEATFAFKLPPGEYELWGYGSGVFDSTSSLRLTFDQPLVDMGTIDLRATGIAKQTGKAPPAWNVTDARGLPKTVKYSDFKGKWVLLEFWGYW